MGDLSIRRCSAAALDLSIAPSDDPWPDLPRLGAHHRGYVGRDPTAVAACWGPIDAHCAGEDRHHLRDGSVRAAAPPIAHRNARIALRASSCRFAATAPTGSGWPTGRTSVPRGPTHADAPSVASVRPGLTPGPRRAFREAVAAEFGLVSRGLTPGVVGSRVAGTRRRRPHAGTRRCMTRSRLALLR